MSPNQSVSGAGQVILTLIDLVRPNTDQEKENRKIQFVVPTVPRGNAACHAGPLGEASGLIMKQREHCG